MSKIVKARLVQGEITPIFADKIRLWNPKSPFRRRLDDVHREYRRWGPPAYFFSGKGATFDNSLLLLIFNNTNIANIGDATGLRGSSTAGSLYASLHTADPGSSGDQTTSEIAYTSYLRVAIARSGAGFTVTSASVSPVAAITFPAGTGGSGTAVAFGIGAIGTAVSAGLRLYNGLVSPNIVCGNTITPSLTTASAIAEA